MASANFSCFGEVLDAGLRMYVWRFRLVYTLFTWGYNKEVLKKLFSCHQNQWKKTDQKNQDAYPRLRLFLIYQLLFQYKQRYY